MRKLLLAVVLLTVAASSGASRADQGDPQLDALFARLPQAQGAAANAIEMQIWALWTHSDDPMAERLLEESAVHLHNGSYPLARQALDALIERAPRMAEAWNRRATLLYLQGDYPAAVRDIQQTLALEPRHFGALSGLGLINLRLERPEAALQAFEAALKINPHMPGPQKYAADLRQMLAGSGI